MKDKRIEVVLQYLDDHVKTKVTLKDIAGIVNLSCGYLSELFKKEAGVTFSFYVKKTE